MQDFSMMSDILYDKDIKEIKKMKELYSEKLKDVLSLFAMSQNNKDIITRNINIFDEIKKKMKKKKLKKIRKKEK